MLDKFSGNWVKISREVFYHELADDKPWSRLATWIYLVAMASTGERTARFRGHDYILKRGQLSVSLGDLEKRTGWSRRRVRCFFDYLKRKQMANTSGDPFCTLVSILNYDKWQGTNCQAVIRKKNDIASDIASDIANDIASDIANDSPEATIGCTKGIVHDIASDIANDIARGQLNKNVLQEVSRKVPKTENAPTPKTRTARVTFDKQTGQFLGLSEELQSKLRDTYPGVDLPQVIREAQLWAVDNRRSDYWGSLKAFCEHSNKGGGNGLNQKRGYRPSIEDAVFTGENFISDTHS